MTTQTFVGSPTAEAIVPLVDVMVARATDEGGGAIVGGEYMECKALVDTGAQWCAISTNMAERLNLVTIDIGTIIGFDGEHQNMPVFGIALSIPSLGFDTFQPVHTTALFPKWDFIIGRRLLRRMRFIYDGHANSYTLTV